MEWTQIVLRSLFAIAMLYLLTRILGKKQISQLTFFEYITGITLGDLAGFISTDIEANYSNGIAALLTWFLIPLGIEFVSLKSIWLRQILDGKGTVMIREGKVMGKNLKKERYTVNELLEQLRTKNVFNVADVEFAVLEPSGDLSVLLKKENQPLTAKDLGLAVKPVQMPQAVIMDGSIMDEALAAAGFSRAWLHTELEKLGVTKENVFLGQVDSYGKLYIDLYDDKLPQPVNNEMKLLLANMKKCEADLTLYGLFTQNGEAKALYEHAAEQLRPHIDKLAPILSR